MTAEIPLIFTVLFTCLQPKLWKHGWDINQVPMILSKTNKSLWTVTTWSSCSAEGSLDLSGAAWSVWGTLTLEPESKQTDVRDECEHVNVPASAQTQRGLDESRTSGEGRLRGILTGSAFTEDLLLLLLLKGRKFPDKSNKRWRRYRINHQTSPASTSCQEL